jgi:hypothetical protein
MTAADDEGHFLIDQRLEAYETFFDHAWAKKTLDLADGSVIYKAAFDLLASWKAIANSHRMPWASMQFMKSFWDSFVSEQSITPKVIRALRKRLWKEVPGLSDAKRRLIRDAMQRIVNDVALNEAQKTAAFSHRNLWAELVVRREGHGFALGIWGSQRLCYPALYHFYEDFFRQVMAMRMGKPDYRVPPFPQFVKHVRKNLGAEICPGSA